MKIKYAPIVNSIRTIRVIGCTTEPSHALENNTSPT